MRSRWVLWAAVGAALLASPPVLAQPPASEMAMSGRARAGVPDETALDMARRQELIPQILGAREAASSREMSPQFRGWLAGELMSVPAPSLEAFFRAGGLGDIEALVLGDTGADLVYTPVTPCRIINTQLAGGPIAGGTTRNFLATGNNFASQGGFAGSCGVPFGPATAVVINFVAVGPAGPGDLRITPFGTPMPLASFLNYANVSGLNIANGLPVTICNPAVATCTSDITIQADVSGVHLVADVEGFFRRVDKSVVKSFSVLSLGAFSTTANACGNYGSLRTTITAPVAGKVVVNAAVTLFVGHVTGNSDELDFHWGTTATDCTTSAQFLFLPSQLPSANYFFPLADTQRFSVAAGSTTTFFFNSNAFVSGGAFIDISFTAAMTATFIPD